MREFVMNNNKCSEYKDGFYDLQLELITYDDEDDKGVSKERIKDREDFEKDFKENEFWNKVAIGFFKSSEKHSNRLMFCCGSRSNYVYDLQMDAGLLKLYSKKDQDDGNAVRLQKKPFLRQMDIIENRFISYITTSKEAKWKKTVNLNDKKALGILKET